MSIKFHCVNINIFIRVVNVLFNTTKIFYPLFPLQYCSSQTRQFFLHPSLSIVM